MYLIPTHHLFTLVRFTTTYSYMKFRLVVRIYTNTLVHKQYPFFECTLFKTVANLIYVYTYIFSVRWWLNIPNNIHFGTCWFNFRDIRNRDHPVVVLSTIYLNYFCWNNSAPILSLSTRPPPRNRQRLTSLGGRAICIDIYSVCVDLYKQAARRKNG